MDPNYRFIANDRFMRNGEQVLEVKNFLFNFYTQWRPQNKTVIVNKNIWDRANPKENNKIRLIQLYSDRVLPNNKIRMYTAIKTYRGQNSITKYATHIRQIKISVKHLIKLRKKYRNFELKEFDEWHFDYPLTTQLIWFQQDINYYKYYNWPQYRFAIFRCSDRTYDKWFKSTYKIFNGISSKPLSIFGDLNEAKKVFNKNLTPIKNLVEKIKNRRSIKVNARAKNLLLVR